MTLRQFQERVNSLVNMHQGWLDNEIFDFDDIIIFGINSHQQIRMQCYKKDGFEKSISIKDDFNGIIKQS